jgi:hypothetical protein
MLEGRRFGPRDGGASMLQRLASHRNRQTASPYSNEAVWRPKCGRAQADSGGPTWSGGAFAPYASRISRPCAVTAQITRMSIVITMSAQSG